MISIIFMNVEYCKYQANDFDTRGTRGQAAEKAIADANRSTLNPDIHQRP
jgi:hypothetical protein